MARMKAYERRGHRGKAEGHQSYKEEQMVAGRSPASGAPGEYSARPPGLTLRLQLGEGGPNGHRPHFPPKTQTALYSDLVSRCDSSWMSTATFASAAACSLPWCAQKSSSPEFGSRTRTYAWAPQRSQRSRAFSGFVGAIAPVNVAFLFSVPPARTRGAD